MKLDDGTMQEGYLRRLTLREVSGCGRGMNPLARVLLLKADGSPGVTKIFKTTAELPKAVRDVLPAEAQATFLKVANAALAKAPDDDEAALKQAWAAVKSAWAKGGDGKWVKKAKKPDDPEDDDKDGKNGKKKPPPWMTAKLVDRVAKAFYGYGSPASDGGTAAVGARSFDDLIDEREAQQEQDEVNQELWPLFSALEQSVRSIIAADDVPDDGKLPLIRQSVEQFMIAMGETVSETLAEAELDKLLKAIPALAGHYEAGETGDPVPTGKESPMDAATQKIVDDLRKEVATLTTGIDAAKAQVTELTTKLTEATTAKGAVETELAALKKANEIASTDEVIEIVDPTDNTKKMVVRKSVVGEQNWLLHKAAQERAEKAEAREQETVFTKRASEEIGNLPGAPVVLGKVLKAAEAIVDKDVREATIAALKAGSAALKKSFTEIGKGGGPASGSAEERLDKAADEYAAANKVSKAVAYDAVLKTPEGKQLYAESEQEKQRR